MPCMIDAGAFLHAIRYKSSFTLEDLEHVSNNGIAQNDTVSAGQESGKREHPEKSEEHDEQRS